MSKDFKQGASTAHPTEFCPRCGASMPVLVFRFKKFGEHTLVACSSCKTVTVDGDKASDLQIGGTP